MDINRKTTLGELQDTLDRAGLKLYLNTDSGGRYHALLSGRPTLGRLRGDGENLVDAIQNVLDAARRKGAEL